MNYYNFHIGDYRRDTTHLSMLEHGAYRQLLDMYYLNETPIPTETQVVIRRLSARSQDEVNAVEIVLKEFFIETPDGYVHKRCDADIAQYQAKADINKVNGKLGGRPKKTQVVIDGLIIETKVEPKITLTNNQEPITNNQEPNKTKTAPQAASAKARKSDDADFLLSLESKGVSLDVAKDWLKVRKAKRLASTETALKGFIAEASKAGLTVPDAVQLCCVRGWGGLDADWIKPKSHASPQVYESKRDKDRRETIEALTGRKQNEQRSENIIDIN